MADDLGQLQTGRDDRGRFLSKRRIQDIALRQLNKQSKATETARKTIDRLTKSTSQQAKTVAKLIKTQQKQYKAQAKGLKQGQKETARAIKDLRKMATSTQKSADRQIKAYQKIAREKIKAMRAGMKGGGLGGGGIGLSVGLPAFLSVAAITAATSALSSYIQQLGRLRGHVTALYGADRNINEALGLRSRDQKFLAGLAEQSPMVRLLSEKQLDSVLQIREKLRQKLGTQIGDDLSQKLLGSMTTFSELRGFADEAGVSIERALSHYQNFDPASFETALDAIRMKQDEVNKTANVLESSFIEIKSAFEDFAVSILEKHGGSIRGVISAIAKSVVDNINKFRKWFADQRQQWSWLIATVNVVNKALNALAKAAGFAFDKIRKTFKYAWETGLGGKFGLGGVVGERNKAIEAYDKRILDLLKQQRHSQKMGHTEVAEAAKREIAVLRKKRRELHEANLDLFAADKERERTVQDFKPPDFAAFFTKAEELNETTRKNAKGLNELSNAFRTAGATAEETARQDLATSINLQQRMIDLAKSRQRMMESSPLGRLGSLQQQLATVKEIDRQRALIEQQIRNYLKLEKLSTKQQEELISLETQRNNLVAERNVLLQQQTRGYLDAVQAMALGAGRFEKIIITQEKNVAKAMEKNIADRNRMLGAVGKDALKDNVMPFRFGANMDKNIQDARRYAAEIREVFKDELGGAPVLTLPPELQNLMQSGLKVDAPKSIPVDAPKSIRLELPETTPNLPTVPKLPTVTPPQPERPQPQSAENFVYPSPSQPKTGRQSAPIVAMGVSAKLDRAGSLLQEAARELEGERQLGVTPLVMQSVMSGQP